MASLSQAKTLGGIGSILLLLAAVPTVGFILAIVGLILILIAVKYISDVVQDSSIFRDIVIGIGIAIAGLIVFGLIVFSAVIKFVGSLAGLTSLTTLTTLTTSTGVSSLPPGLVGFVETVLAGIAVLWLLFIASSVFVRMSYKKVAQRLNVGLFGTAALLYLIGAILTVVLIGLVIILVAEILLIIAFFSIPEAPVGMGATMPRPPPPSPMGPGVPPPTQTISSGRTCPRCGAPVAQDAVFCPSCGSSLSR